MVEKFKNTISKFTHSESKVPYTYHHDYMRENVASFSGMSRSDVASITTRHTEEQLYAVALTYIINNYMVESILNLTDSDLQFCKLAVIVTNSLIKQY